MFTVISGGGGAFVFAFYDLDLKAAELEPVKGRSTVVLLDTGIPGTSGEIYSVCAFQINLNSPPPNASLCQIHAFPLGTIWAKSGRTTKGGQ